MKRNISQQISALLLSLLLCASLQSHAQTNLVPDDQEFQALKALYDSLGGPNWTNKTNWPTPGNWPATATAAQMGTWFGVTVQSGDIFKVILSANNLTGKVPAAISLMSQVTQIQLNSNHLTGSVPSSLGSLSKLLWLRFDTNQLTGSVPTSLGNLPLIQHLYFDGNSLTGTIPPALGNLSSLLVLSLSNNQLTGSIPASFGGLQSLTSLYLQGNELSGSVPESLGNLTNLINLYIRDNQLTGALPASLGNLTKLKTLFADVNALTGSIPASLGNLADLEYLRLQQNQLTGSIPPQLGNLSKLLQLYVNQNKLTGELPASLGNLTKLQYLNALSNQLTGAVPSSFENLTSLVFLNLSTNKLSGDLPDMFGSMTKLANVDLSGNYFTGAFPSSIGSCALLIYVNVNNNRFTSFPASALTLPVLNYVNVENNEVSVIPDFSTHANKANLGLWLRNNRLDFARLEPLINAGIAGVTYNPQKAINDVVTQPLIQGSALVLTARPAGEFSAVAWEKQNPNTTWATLTNDQDTNPLTYTRTTATLADEGAYRWRATNTKLPGLTVQSEPMNVKIPTHFVLDDLAFQYKYDARRRMTHKKVPGADWVYMVYDDRDRLVMTQDGEQRKTNKWSFTKYDALNRPVMTGIYTHSAFADQAGMSGLISTANFFETYNGDATNHGYSKVVFPTTGTEVLTVTYYDNYNFVTEDAYQFDDDALEGQYLYAAGSAFPRVTGQVTGTKTRMLSGNAWARTVNYYDDQYRVVQIVTGNNQGGVDRTTNRYDFVGKVLETSTVHVVSGLRWKNAVNIEVTGNTLIKTGAGSWGNAGAVSAQILPAGTDGWMEVVVPENGYWTQHIGLSSADPNSSYTNIEYGFRVQGFYYAYVYENGVQPSQSPASISVVPGDVLRVSRTGNTVKYYKNGVLLYTSAVPSTGQLMVDCALKETGTGLQDVRASFIPSSQSVIRRTFNYDHAGRLLKTWHSVNDATPVLMAQNEYNELGQLVTKNLHNTDPEATPDASRAFRQQLDYRYNIRGWLTRVNNSDVSITENGPRDYFGMNLFYNETVLELSGSQPQFNGNISAMKWSTNLGLGGSVPALEVDGPKENAYAFRYDTLNRLKSAAFHTKPSTGWGASTAYHEDNLKYDHNGNIKSLNRTTAEGVSMDQLTYAYSGNQLLKVSDASDKTKGFVDGPSPDNDYTYDANGNMTLDRNKEITAITYNHLNLPDKVTKSTGEYVKYTYDATGRKLSQGVYTASNVLKKKSDYAGEFFYENDTLKFVNHEEGRVVMTGAAPEYQYYLKDIWHNTRLTFTTKSEASSDKATYEPANAVAEQSKFLRYATAKLVNAAIFDKTNGSSVGYAERLNGSENEKFGIGKSLSVMPGDTVKMEVYAKYVDKNTANWSATLNTLMGQIAANTAGVVTEGYSYNTSTSSFNYSGLLNTSGSTGNGPKAYLNWLIFDRDYNFVNGGYQRMTDIAKESGEDVAHERLAASVIITQPGFVYVYLSNEETTPVEVFFDEFEVAHSKSTIIEVTDYYPFGLQYGHFTREGKLENKTELFQGQEYIMDLDLEWYSFKYRNYAADVGRFFNADPLSHQYVYNSPYAFAENKLGRGVELEGRELLEFLKGAANAIVTNHHPTQAGRGTEKDADYKRGQQAGDMISVGIGILEMYNGGSASIGGVLLAPETAGLSLTISAAGVAAFVEGMIVSNNAIGNLMKTEGDTNQSSNRQKTDDTQENTPSDVSTKKDRQKADTQLERAQNQLEGIEKAQDAAKKQQQGQKQNKINSTKKSEQRLENELKNIKSLDDLE